MATDRHRPKRRVLFLCAEAYPPPYAFLDRVFNHEVAKSGFDVAWVMPKRDAQGIEAHTWSGHPVWTIPKVQTASAADLVPSYVRHFKTTQAAVAQAAASLGPIEIVQVRDDPLMALVGSRFAQKLRVPFVYQLSHLKEEESLLWATRGIYGGRAKNTIKGAVGFGLRQAMLQRADVIFPISTHMGDQLARYRVSRGNIVPLPEGVQTDLFAPLTRAEIAARRQDLKLPPGPLLVYVGSTSRMRRLDVVIDAIAAVREQFAGLHLLVVGGDDHPGDLANLQTQVARLKLEKTVTFTGAVPSREVPNYIRIADLGISPIPSNIVYRSSSPIKVLEYMAAGLPVVATDIPTQVDLMRDANAGHCVSHSRDGFADGISRWLNMPEEQRQQAGKRSRQYVEQHRDFKVLARRVTEAYARLVGGGP